MQVIAKLPVMKEPSSLGQAPRPWARPPCQAPSSGPGLLPKHIIVTFNIIGWVILVAHRLICLHPPYKEGSHQRLYILSKNGCRQAVIEHNY